MVDGGAQAGVRRGHLFGEQIGHQLVTLVQQELESRLGCAGRGAVLQVFGGRSQHDVAVDGRAHQHPLATGGGDR